jgi:hypothetical protein
MRYRLSLVLALETLWLEVPLGEVLWLVMLGFEVIRFVVVLWPKVLRLNDGLPLRLV